MPNNQPARENIQDELLRGTAVLRAIPDGAVICDRAKNVRFINPAAAHVLQIDADAYTGRSLDRLPGGIVLPNEIGDQEYHQLIEMGYEDWRCNVRAIWSETHKKAQIGFLITIKPVSLEILSLEELRILIGYEIRTPLTSIKGCAELMLRGFAGELSEQQRELMRIFDNASKRLFGAVDNLMTAIQLDSSRMRLPI